MTNRNATSVLIGLSMMRTATGWPVGENRALVSGVEAWPDNISQLHDAS